MMKTATGFEYEINKDSFNNMELIDAFAELETNPESITASSKVIRLLLGNETRERLYEHVREADGRVPIDKVMVEFTEIIKSLTDEQKK